MGPKNNLDDVLRRRTSNPNLNASNSGSKSETNKFKPAVATTGSTTRKSLPVFVTPGFRKTTQRPSEVIDLSTELVPTIVGTKRSASFSEPSTKKVKTEQSYDKENTKPKPLSVTKPPSITKPPPVKKPTKPIPAEPSRPNTPLVVEGEIIDLCKNVKPIKPEPLPPPPPRTFKIHDPFEDLERDFPELCAPSGLKFGVKARFNHSDLDSISATGLKSLLAYNTRLQAENQRELDKHRNKGTLEVDLYVLDAFREILSSRVEAIRNLIGTGPPDTSSSEQTRSHYFSGDDSSRRASTSSAFTSVSPTDKSPSTTDADMDDITDDILGSDDLWEGMDDITMDFDDDPFDDEIEIISPPTNALAPTEVPGYILNGPYYKEIMSNLRSVYGLSTFRTNQLEAIHETMSGRDVFVLMPTGGGKSLCYQLPAVCQTGSTKGTTIVVSPLLALMQNQVAGLQEKNVDVLLWNSETLDAMEIIRRLRGFPKPSLVYVTPEKLRESNSLKGILRDLYQTKQLARFVIDEAHCISTWGKDFREAYQALGALRDEYPSVPIIALTATANKMTVDDIMKRLKLRNCASFTQSFNRSNLNYVIMPKKKNPVDDIVRFITDRHLNKTGVIYCLGRDKTEQVAKQLRDKGLNAKHFHAKLDPMDKDKILKEWQSGQVHIIVATIAFGMGIDKPDVRYVIHHDLPKSLDGYYQETGRAGRDGKPADCVLYYGYRDFEVIRKMIRKDRDVPRESMERQEQEARNVVAYCENDSVCRRVQLLQFFGEKFDKKLCHRRCDNCKNEDLMVEHDLTREAADAVQLVRSVERENVTIDQCRLILKGSKNATILNKGYDRLPLYGAASHLSLEVVELLFSKLLFQDALMEESIANASGWHSQYVKLGNSAQKFLRGKTEMIVRYRPKAPKGGSGTERRTKKNKPKK